MPPGSLSRPQVGRNGAQSTLLLWRSSLLRYLFCQVASIPRGIGGAQSQVCFMQQKQTSTCPKLAA